MLPRAKAVMVGQANIAENESLGIHFNALRRKGAKVTENVRRIVHDLWNQLHQSNSGQQMLPGHEHE